MKNCSKVSVIDAVDGSISNFFITAIRFNSKSFGSKQCRYSKKKIFGSSIYTSTNNVLGSSGAYSHCSYLQARDKRC